MTFQEKPPTTRKIREKARGLRSVKYILLGIVAFGAIGFGFYFKEWAGPAIIIAFLAAIWAIFFRDKEVKTDI